MKVYPFNGVADMHLIHDGANNNGLRAACLCQEKFPHQRHPTHKMFAAIDRRIFRLLLSVEEERDPSGHLMVRRGVLDRAEENPVVSIRQIATELSAKQMAVW
jgi:hypothetical protein